MDLRHSEDAAARGGWTINDILDAAEWPCAGFIVSIVNNKMWVYPLGWVHVVGWVEKTSKDHIIVMNQLDVFAKS